MDVSVFYSWQSDRSPSRHWHFIRAALDAAVERIRMDAHVYEAPRVEAGVEGLPGMPNIPDTILERIENSGVFVADVTFVGLAAKKREGVPQKLLSNPNVLLELGYAARAIGWDRIVLIMNTAHGGPASQIFDLQHRRHPIKYHLESGQEKGSVAEKLVEELTEPVALALRATHRRVAETLARLDDLCFFVMANFGHVRIFNFMGQQFPLGSGDQLLTEENCRAGVRRLLDLGLLSCRTGGNNVVLQFAYHWTYLGKLCLQGSGFIPQDV